MDLLRKLFAPVLVLISAGIASAQAFDPATEVTNVTTSINSHLNYIVPLAIGLFGVVFLLRLVRRWMGKAGS